MSTKNTTIPAFTFSIRDNGSYSGGKELICRFAFIDTTKRTGSDCYEGDITPWGYDAAEKYKDLKDLEFHQYIDKDNGRPFGSGPCWQIYRMDISDVQRIAKVANKIERGLEKIRESRGYVVDCVDWFGRMCEVLGINLILQYDPERSEQRGYTYRSMNLGDGLSVLRYELHKLVPETESVPA